MNGILVICCEHKNLLMIKEVLFKLKSQNIFYVENIDKAKKMMLEQHFELIIVDSTLSSQNYIDFVKNVIKVTNSQVLLMLKSEFYENIAYELEQMGIYTLAKPYNRTTLFNVLRMCSVSIRNINKVKNEINKLQKRLVALKLVNQAKLILIQKFNMNEDEAHHFIEKKAMDYQTTKIIIAKKIINKYG